MRVDALQSVRIIAIAAAEFHWLALDSLGRVFACGNNASGQLALAHTNPVFTPAHVSALFPHPIIAIATGDTHSAVLSATGIILSFGSNKHGQLGHSHFVIRLCSPTPLPVHTPQSALHPNQPASLYFTDISCGSAHTVALRSDAKLATWGKGDTGQLGTRATRTLYDPTILNTPALHFVSVSAGDQHSAAITADGTAYMWGDGSLAQLGDGDLAPKYFPIPLSPPSLPNNNTNTNNLPARYIRIQCGGFHTLALVANDQTPVYNPYQEYSQRIPRCTVDTILTPNPAVTRFGTPSVLLRTFVVPNLPPLAEGKVLYVHAETTYLKFLSMFGPDATRVLQHAAASIRRQAQVAFGLVLEDNSNSVLTSLHRRHHLDQKNPPVTPRANFINNQDHFRSSVANTYESGYLFFLALLNPVYADPALVPQLSELAALLLRVENDGREAFLQHVSYCEEGVLINRLIRPLQAVLTTELKRYHRITRNAIFATKALALCYHAVWRASRRKKIRSLTIPRHEFYNETVSELVDFGEDYERWSDFQRTNSNNNSNKHSQNCNTTTAFHTPADRINQMELPPLPIAGQEDGPFSFCTYHFLLSEAAKFRILEIESQHTMTKESMRSVLSFGALPMPIGPWGRVSHMRLPPEQMAHLQFLVLQVSRDNIVSDAFIQIGELVQRHPRELHKPLKVRFFGEDGVDEGGVRKEFYQVLLEHIMSPNYGMFENDEETNFHWFRRDFLEPEYSWTLIGIMFGLAAFNSILLDVQFPPVIYRKLAVAFRNNFLRMEAQDNNTQPLQQLEYKADLNDVKETFPAIGNSLQHLAAYEGDDVEDVFGLTFEISYEGLFGKMKTVELVYDGAKKAVTSDNRQMFIDAYINYLMQDSIKLPFNNFTAGFASILSGPFVHMLTADELETLVAGEKELDFGGLRGSAKYEGYSQNSSVIVNFWQVLSEYDEELKRLFLSFVTGTDRAPIGGLRKLILIIQRAEGDSNRLPTSHTCFNVLLLPEYGTRAKLRDRLSTAIRNSKGFGLR